MSNAPSPTPPRIEPLRTEPWRIEPWIFGLVASAGLTCCVLLLLFSAAANVVQQRAGPVMPQAERAFAAGKVREAIVMLQDHLRDVPNDGPAVLLLSRAYIEAGEQVAAEWQLDRARSLAVDPAAIDGLLGPLYLAQRRFGKLLAKIPSNGPDTEATARNLALRARAFAGSNDRSNAEAALASAERLAPRSPDVLLAAGELAMSRNDLATAAAKLDAALMETPAHTETLLLRSQVAWAGGDSATALGFTDRAVMASPGSAAPRLTRATLLMAAGNNAGALVDVRAVLATRPRNGPAHYLEGVLALRDGHYREALQQFQHLGPEMAGYGRVEYFTSLAALGSGLPATAGEMAARYAARNPADIEALRMLEQTQAGNNRQAPALEALALSQIKAGDTEQARMTMMRLREVQRREPSSTLTGALAMAERRPEDAIEAFKAAASAATDSLAARIDLARAYAAAGQVDKARDTLAKVLQDQPAQLSVLSSFVRLQVGRGAFESALRVIEAARQAAPETVEIAALRSDVLIRSGDAPQAVATLERLRARAGLAPVLLAALARAQAACGRTEEAMASYRDALAGAPDPQTAIELAQLEAARQPDMAKATLDKAVAAHPADFALLTRRVDLERETAGVDAAIRLAARFSADPAHAPVAHVLEGDTLMRAGRPATAAATYRAAWHAMPSTALALRLAEAQMRAGDDAGAKDTLLGFATVPDAALLLSQIEIRAKNWPLAVQRLERALQGRGNDARLLNNLAWAYEQVGDPRAEATARRAHHLAPTSDTADTLGWILVRRGAANDALPLLQEAARQSPGDLSVSYHEAVAMARAGKTSEAVESLTKLLAAHPAFDEREDAKALLATIAAHL